MTTLASARRARIRCSSLPACPACPPGECWTTADLPNFGDNPVEEYIEEAASLDSEGLR